MNSDLAVERPIHHRLAMLVSGWGLVALGVSAILRADLGAGPFDVLNTAVAGLLGTAIGTASWVTAGVLLLIAYVLGARPGVATFTGVFAVGFGVNLFMALIPTAESLVVRSALLAVAVCVLCVGITLVVLSGLGSSVIDLLMIAIHRRGATLRTARLGIEVSAVLVGVALGGSVGVATLLIAVGIGPALSHSLRLGSTLLAPATA